MAGIPNTGIPTLLSSSKVIMALACWTLIAVVDGSTSTLAGVKTLRLAKNCRKINIIIGPLTKTQTSILCGHIASSMVIIASMLTATKHWVGSCYVIQHHNQKEFDHLSQARGVVRYLCKNFAGLWSGYDGANSTAERTGLYLSHPPRVDHVRSVGRTRSQVLRRAGSLGFLRRASPIMVPAKVLEFVILEYYFLRLTNKSWFAIIYT